MARSMYRLSPKQVENAVGPKHLSDGGGLYLRLDASGGKRWVFRYTRPGGGKVSELGLGGFPGTTLKSARALAQGHREQLVLGIDPAAAKQAERQALREAREKPTFATVANEYIDLRIAPESRNSKHLYQWRQTLGESYCGRLCSMRVDEIETRDIVEVLQREHTKRVGKKIVRGKLWTLKHETATRLRGRIEKVLDHASHQGYRAGENPARWAGRLEHALETVKKPAEPNHYAAMPYSAVPAFVAELAKRTAVSARALEFLILTAARAGEVRGAVWSEIDMDAAVWTVPASRMKAEREHRVPLTERCLEILHEMAPEPALRHGFVFPSTKEGVAMSDMVFNALMRRMNVDGATAHGFRSSFRDWVGEETDHSGEVAEAALAHILGNKVERAYRRGTAFVKRKLMMEDWAAYCKGSQYES